ncbi:serine hydrolase [Streptomyces sp. DG2A-72]|uniref:serine hydrolase n=1 Tax=Streptomyces sp. DG2A-72 TaxID=3051386 RepID=UPI00265B8EAF|nr:serine hydrolase [Streptomyces sp. DG2A-72]MDO0939399.1 serine hydrolase [Streptomyces sp. DG2A-72]
MPDRQNRTHTARGLGAHTLRGCAATAVVVSLAACSVAGTPYRAQAPVARTVAPAPGPAARENLGATLARALRPVLPGSDRRLAVAVLALDSADQEVASYGQDAAFDTASIIKVGILATLLLQAQDEERELTAAERRSAEAMIRTSDNDATNVLWRAIGEAEGLDTAGERLGLSSTRGGPGMRWGLTQTTATDQVKLLRAIFARGPAALARPPEGLNEASRACIRELMGSIAQDQDWGVSAAGSPGSRWALKNGWLRRTTTGLWVINSVGQVTVHGRRYLVSVLSSGNASIKSGISLVERAARAAIGAASAHVRPWPQ